MLGIVVVTYKSFADTVAFVQRELPKISVSHKAVIVDLGSDYDYASSLADACQASMISAEDEAAATHGDLYLLHVSDNLGFARGNNLGVNFLLQNFPTLRWLLISNDDIGLREGGAVEELIRQLELHQEAGMAGPRIIDRNGKEQMPFARPHTFATIFWHNLLFPLLNRFGERDRNFLLSTEQWQVSECYFVRGCFLVVRAAEFQSVGMFDPATFLYYEEPILAERYLRLGKTALYCPGVTIDHYSGKTTEQHINSIRFVGILRQSFRHYFQTYRKVGKVRLALLDLSFWMRLALIRLTDPIQKWRQQQK